MNFTREELALIQSSLSDFCAHPEYSLSDVSKINELKNKIQSFLLKDSGPKLVVTFRNLFGTSTAINKFLGTPPPNTESEEVLDAYYERRENFVCATDRYVRHDEDIMIEFDIENQTATVLGRNPL